MLKTDFELEILGKIREALGLVGRYSIHTGGSPPTGHPLLQSSMTLDICLIFDFIEKTKIDYFPNFVFSKKEKLNRVSIFQKKRKTKKIIRNPKFEENEKQKRFEIRFYAIYEAS